MVMGEWKIILFDPTLDDVSVSREKKMKKIEQKFNIK